MKYDLTQSEIDRLDDYEYAMFLAYGATFRDQETVPTGTGDDKLWEDTATRLIEEARREELRFGKRLWSVVYNRRTPFSY